MPSRWLDPPFNASRMWSFPMTFAICRNWALSPDLSAVIEVTERLEELVRFAPLGFLVLERMIRLYHWA